MRKTFLLIAVICIFSILTGCFESKVPLSSSQSSRIDEKLVNYWISIPKEKNENKISLAIFKFNENEHLVIGREGKENETIITRGFITKIKNTKIINLQNIKSLEKSERTYVFFKYDFNARGNLLARILSADSPLLKNKEFKNSEAFYAFMEKNIEKEGLFDTSIEFKLTNEIDFGMIS